VEAEAWEIPSRGRGYICRLQIREIDGRSINKIKKLCNDWHNGGYGWNKENSHRLLLFSKKFKTREDWEEYSKTLPFEVTTLD
tara:strand:+ start:192 stop:440 length:249 start_codon:yes stop_codon:yes gene_type:complete